MNHGITLESLRAAVHGRVRGGRLLPRADRGGRGAPRAQARSTTDSELNGRGPHAWSRHWLLVPLAEPQGRTLGLIWVDDPRDRLLPTRARLQALRLFANQAVAALQSADQALKLRHEATHDALTGAAQPARLPRRGWRSRRPGRTAAFALILCDMDNLKRVNDTLGHEAGDLALQLLADALRTGLRRDDAYRLGGDEFAVVLAGASELDAERVLRRARSTPSSRAARPPIAAIEASFGLAVYEPGESPTAWWPAPTRSSTRRSAAASRLT